MSDDRAALGRAGESLIASKLERDGFTILARNARLGRDELDIVARRGQLTVFCEVRSRRGRAGFSPAETVTHAKRERVRRAARAWLAANGGSYEVRLDVAAVTFLADGTHAIDYFEDAL